VRCKGSAVEAGRKLLTILSSFPSGWENAFAQRLFAIRNDKELAMLRKMGYLQSFSTFTWNIIRSFRLLQRFRILDI
jgi:hypothetical protein